MDGHHRSKSHKRHRRTSPDSDDSRQKKHKDDRNQSDRIGSHGDDSDDGHRKKYKHHERNQKDHPVSKWDDSDDSRQKKHRDRNRSDRHHSNGVDNRDSRNHRHHRDRDFDPNIRIKQEKDQENFNQQQNERSHHDRKRRDNRRERDRQGGDFGMNREVKKEKDDNDKTEEEKQKPNFELSGKLTEDTNTFRGVVIKYNEPQEAMMPKRKWRLYPFKGEEALPVLHIHRQSAFLLGRLRKIADIPIDHPSCSQQHAVLQFRAMPYTRPDGSDGRRVRPYIIDLESANGTYVNGDKIEGKRYYELKEKDVIKFGFSSREYVILHDKVSTSELGVGEDMEEL